MSYTAGDFVMSVGVEAGWSGDRCFRGDRNGFLYLVVLRLSPFLTSPVPPHTSRAWFVICDFDFSWPESPT